MTDFSSCTILKQPAIRGGLSLFLSGVAFCGIGRYMKIEGQPLAFQIKAFSIAAIAQTAIHATIGNNSENSRIFEFIAPVVLIGIVAKKSRFKKLVVSTSLVSTELPMNRTNGGLCIDDCIRITELPENLYVNGDLSIFNHPITELPRGLHIGG